MSKIILDGGYIEANGVWYNAATGEPSFFWTAHSDHTGEEIVCYSKALAEYFVWVIHERIASMQFRGAM